MSGLSHRSRWFWFRLETTPALTPSRYYRSVPQLSFTTLRYRPDGSILVEPSNAELAEKLGLTVRVDDP